MTDDQSTQAQDRDEEQRQNGGDGGDDQASKARRRAEQEDEAKQKVRELEDDPPARLEDWPDDKAKYETFGGAEGNEGYEESVTSKLGPSSLRYRKDGGVEIEGEAVDDPDEYKADPIPGGPTDPRIKGARAYGEPDLTEETSIDPEAAIDEARSSDEGDSGDEGEPEGSEQKRETEST